MSHSGQGAHRLGAMQTLPRPMRKFRDDEVVDYCVVGVGSAGGVLVQRLARAGFRVVGLEAGPFWDTEKDWVSDEKASHELYWNELRITGGTDPLALGENNSGKGVGGGSVHWAAFTPRFHPSDFRVYSEDSVGADWPISYWDLKPYYELLEREIPVAGPAWFPWGDPHGHPYGPHPLGGVGDILVRGCTKLGIRDSGGRPRRDPFRFSWRSSALHLPRLLHSGLQGGREGEHAHHACSRRHRTRRGDSRAFHGGACQSAG